jgi:antitoxin (DNA-binding transcriptional repressor) of toxin-antitoxin stability system
METVSIREAQHNLSAFLRRVENGEKIAIRRRGRVIAQLVPETETATETATATDEDASTRKVDWSVVRECTEAYWKDRPSTGKSIVEVLLEARGDR